MKILLVLILLLLIALYFTYPVVRAIRTSKTIEEQTTPHEQHPPEPTMYVLVAGDSTGVGTGADEPQHSMAGYLGADFPAADIVNISQNGLTLEGLTGILPTEPERRYDLLVLQIGANDVLSFASSKTIRTEIRKVLEYASTHAHETIVLTAGNMGLTPVFKFPLSTIVTARTLMVRRVFMEEIEKYPSVRYVDLFEEKEDDVFGTDIEKYYAKDLFHPSEHGYRVWYEKVKKVVEERE